MVYKFVVRATFLSSDNRFAQLIIKVCHRYTESKNYDNFKTHLVISVSFSFIKKNLKTITYHHNISYIIVPPR